MSTLRQLGLMVFVLFQGEKELRFVHISCHALFKALLFLRCGLFIVIRYGMQDSRKIGSLGMIIYLGGVGLIGSSLSLMGFPFSTGFYSKDPIIEMIYYDGHYLEGVIMILGCLITFIYSLRLICIGLGISKIGFLEIKNHEDFFLLKFIGLIYFYIVTMGVFLHWEIDTISWWMIDLNSKILGILIILFGFVIWNFNVLGIFNKWVWQIVDLFFLKWISTGGFSKILLITFNVYRIDILWGEIFGPWGIKSLLRVGMEKVERDFIIMIKILIIIVIFMIYILLFSFKSSLSVTLKMLRV